ncbi:hypothetical protein Y032_0145g2496 [Ancylostoma ceylanicum]|uniref:Uncharacterized protein n=1 Tax=Ancylostoma ceylanicum TaxID=53326 RepID=A0A016T1Q6_9BILA|nr:hypothetical protein Y032_0145g2496 [Ancylostoma ceylanicum]
MNTDFVISTTSSPLWGVGGGAERAYLRGIVSYAPFLAEPKRAPSKFTSDWYLPQWRTQEEGWRRQNGSPNFQNYPIN